MSNGHREFVVVNPKLRVGGDLHSIQPVALFAADRCWRHRFATTATGPATAKPGLGLSVASGRVFGNDALDDGLPPLLAPCRIIVRPQHDVCRVDGLLGRTSPPVSRMKATVAGIMATLLATGLFVTGANARRRPSPNEQSPVPVAQPAEPAQSIGSSPNDTARF